MLNDQYARHTTYIHTAPGRLRVNVPAVRASRDTALDVTNLLQSLSGVHSATANARTGNVLISFDDAIHSHEELLELLAKAGHLEPSLHPVGVPAGVRPATSDSLGD